MELLSDVIEVVSTFMSYSEIQCVLRHVSHTWRSALDSHTSRLGEPFLRALFGSAVHTEAASAYWMNRLHTISPAAPPHFEVTLSHPLHSEAVEALYLSDDVLFVGGRHGLLAKVVLQGDTPSVTSYGGAASVWAVDYWRAEGLLIAGDADAQCSVYDEAGVVQRVAADDAVFVAEVLRGTETLVVGTWGGGLALHSYVGSGKQFEHSADLQIHDDALWRGGLLSGSQYEYVTASWSGHCAVSDLRSLSVVRAIECGCRSVVDMAVQDANSFCCLTDTGVLCVWDVRMKRAAFQFKELLRQDWRASCPEPMRLCATPQFIYTAGEEVWRYDMRKPVPHIACTPEPGAKVIALEHPSHRDAAHNYRHNVLAMGTASGNVHIATA